jgi:hypothetical protein
LPLGRGDTGQLAIDPAACHPGRFPARR